MKEHGEVSSCKRGVMNRRRVLMAELALVIAGVFVFRGLWMLLDLLAFMHTSAALGLSLLAGSVATVWALKCIMTQEDK